jgi:DNA-binding MarR family transcriptional regulator
MTPAMICTDSWLGGLPSYRHGTRVIHRRSLQRVARYVLALADDDGWFHQSTVDMAAALLTTRQTVSLALAILVDHGVIERAPGPVERTATYRWVA